MLYRLPDSILQGHAVHFFDFIAEKLKEAGASSGEKVGFTFSYPVNQLTICDGTLMRWTKRLNVEGVVGMNVTQLLRVSITLVLPDYEAYRSIFVGCSASSKCGFGSCRSN